MALSYPGFAPIPIDRSDPGAAFQDAFDKSRKAAQIERFERERPEILASLFGGGGNRQPGMSLSALGQQFAAPTGQVQRAPLGAPDPNSARVAQAHGDAPSDAEAKAMSFFTSKGYSPYQAAGIVGNLLQESGLRTGALNPGDGADGSNSIGLAQWNGSRAAALNAFASQNGLSANDFGAQLQFIEHELSGPESGVRERLMAASDPIQATAAFVGFERPQGWTAERPHGAHGFGNRAKHADRLAKAYQSQGGAAPAQAALDSMAVGESMPMGQRPPMAMDTSGNAKMLPTGGLNTVVPSYGTALPPLPDRQTMLRAFANPLTADYAIAAAKSRLDAEAAQNDPMKRLQYETALTELNNLRNPEPKLTDDQREYRQAVQQGFAGTFLDYQQALKKAGATNVTTNVGGTDEFYGAIDKKSAEVFSALNDQGYQAQTKLGQIDQLENLLTSAGTGAGAAMKQFAGEFGIETDGLDDIQAAAAIINQLVPTQRPPGSGTMSDADLALFKRSLPRLINTPDGNQAIIDAMRGITEYQIMQGQIAARVANREISPAKGRTMLNALPNPLASMRSGKGKQAADPARPIARNPQTGETMEWDGATWRAR